MRISIIICTHNPRADYLERTVIAVAAAVASLDHGTECEKLLINNASVPERTEELKALARRFGWKVIEEPTPGLVHARVRGIAESSADLLIWVDDDTELDEDFLQEAVRIYRERPFVGAFGGNVRLELEEDVDPERRPYLHLLTECKVEREEWSNYRNCKPVAGAGLCVRREVAERYIENYKTSELRKLLGRSPTNLFSGEDWDFCLCAPELGLAVGKFPQLGLTHIIPAKRTTIDYLARIAKGHAFSLQIVHTIRNIPLVEYKVKGELRFLKAKQLVKPSLRKKMRIAKFEGLIEGYRLSLLLEQNEKLR